MGGQINRWVWVWIGRKNEGRGGLVVHKGISIAYFVQLCLGISGGNHKVGNAGVYQPNVSSSCERPDFDRHLHNPRLQRLLRVQGWTLPPRSAYPASHAHNPASSAHHPRFQRRLRVHGWPLPPRSARVYIQRIFSSLLYRSW